MAVKPKELRFAVDLEPAGALSTENGATLRPGEEWTPEHILLAALVRCSLKSLHFHADRAGVRVTSESGAASSLVTRRESDGRYAVVEATVELSVALEPRPEPDALADLLAKAERDCFVGASLQAKPSYRWTVDGA
ncbi:MAG TPA: OsmC family protein [Gaiellaceae bacterium]|nr:OsmC family protein [Gaiellaceae bacterium]